MPWRPQVEGEYPTLGWYVLDWISAMLAAPDRMGYEPFLPTLEQAEFVLRFYELDPVTARRSVQRAVLGRPRGWGKSPFLAALAIVEALADVFPDGWGADGQPVGRPWSTVRTPYVKLAAVSEDQTAYTWNPLKEMLTSPDGSGAPVLDWYPGIEVLDRVVNLPRGELSPMTSSATTSKGDPLVFVVMDQTETWVPSNGGQKLARVLLDNVTKTGGSAIESPNAPIAGERSVAETTTKAWQQMLEGRTKLETGIFVDHREAPAETDLADRESLTLGLRIAYGDSSDHPDGCLLHTPPCAPGWAPIEGTLRRIWQPDADPEESKGNFLNMVTSPVNAFTDSPTWLARRRNDIDPIPGELIVLGFDGSRGRAKGKPDATALVGCRVEDGHLFQLGVWEAPDRKDLWASWQPPIAVIEAAIAEAFDRFHVAAFYCDPARDWRSHVNAWEAKYGPKLLRIPVPGGGDRTRQIRATRDHPFEWWMTGGRTGLVQRAIEDFEGALVNGDLTHDGSAGLTRHMLNARRGLRGGKLALTKASDYSENKIDAAVAAVLAWQARLDAIAAGARKPTRSKFALPSRIR